jgi:hypothetical protein
MPVFDLLFIFSLAILKVKFLFNAIPLSNDADDRLPGTSCRFLRTPGNVLPGEDYILPHKLCKPLRRPLNTDVQFQNLLIKV